MLEEKELLEQIKDTQQDYELFYDVDLKALSKDNIKRLQTHLQNGIEGQGDINEDRLPSGLTVREARFVQYVLEQSQFTHNTTSLKAIKDNDHTMESLQVRTQAGQAIKNRHTRAGSKADGYLYFTYGQTTPSFLTYKSQDQITFNPNSLQNQNQQVYQHGFITWYPDAGLQRRRTPLYYLGDCQFHYAHTSETKKQYVYQHPNTPPIQWQITLQQEIFYGEDMLKGLAYQMILHLRLIGGEYRKHVLNNFEDKNVLAAFQDMIYPVDYYPEFKLPCQFKIDAAGVSITETKSIRDGKLSFFDIYAIKQQESMVQGKVDLPYFDDKEKFYKNPSLAKTDNEKKVLLAACVANADVEKIQVVLSENHFDLNEQYPMNTLLNTAIDRVDDPGKRMRIVNLLIQYGADPNNARDKDGKNAFYFAVEKKDKTLFDYLLTVKFPHPLDENINRGPHLHADRGLPDSKHILDLICENNLIDWLALAIQYGANILQFPALLYATAAKNGHVDMVAALIQARVSLTEIPLNTKTPLMIFAQKGNATGVKLMLEHDADVHHYSYFKDEYINALDLAKRAKEPNQNIIRLLEEKGAKETPKQTVKRQLNAVVTVVTGDDENGQRFVLLGQKRNNNNTLDEEYCFPGGLVELTDPDAETAGMRELEEETNIKLNGGKLKGKFSTHTLFTFSENYENKNYQITFVHFHLFVDPKSIRIKADDDLATVHWLALKSLHTAYDKYEKKRYLIKEENTYTLVKQSNGIVLDSLFRINLDKPALQKSLRIDNFGHLLLVNATIRGDIEEIEDLIHHRCTYYFHDTNIGGTPLNIAAAHGRMNVVQFYLTLDPRLLKSPIHPAVSAAQNSHWEIFNLLNKDLNIYSQATVLMHCINNQNLSKILFCLQNFKIDLNQRLEDEQYFITMAAKTGNIKLVRILIHFGADVNPEFIGLDESVIKVFSPLHAAIANRDEDMAIFLIQQGADINCGDNITAEDVLSYSYLHIVKNAWAHENGKKIHTSGLQKNPLSFIEKNHNYNAVMKALKNKCDKVIIYILDNDLYIDPKQLPEKALSNYQDKYPKLASLQQVKMINRY